jgi:hypothetical protein
MNYGQVIFSAHVATVDTAGDIGPEPDIVPLTGYVDFIPSRVVTYVDGSGLVVLPKVTAGIDDQGVLRDAEGNAGITLIAADSPELSHKEWTYEAYIRLNGIDAVVGPYFFVLHSGEIHNLGLDAPAEMSNGIAILRGPAGPPGPPGTGGGGGGGAVESVAGKTGAVTLVPADVGIAAATSTTAGLVKASGDVVAAADGGLNVPSRVVPVPNFDNSNPARPNTQATVLWITPDANRPATNGSKSGGAYAAAEGDLLAVFT